MMRISDTRQAVHIMTRPVWYVVTDADSCHQIFITKVLEHEFEAYPIYVYVCV